MGVACVSWCSVSQPRDISQRGAGNFARSRLQPAPGAWTLGLGRRSYLALGGYFSNAFRTISSSFPSTLKASPFSSRTIARHTSDFVDGSRRSSTSVPSVYGPRPTRVPQPRQPAGYLSSSAFCTAPSVYLTLSSDGPEATNVRPLASSAFWISALIRFLTSSLLREAFLAFSRVSRIANVWNLEKSTA